MIEASECLFGLALFLPLVGAVFAATFGCVDKRLFVGYVNSVLMLGVFIVACILGFSVVSFGTLRINLFDWLCFGDFRVSFGFMLDSINVVMMLAVSLVGLLVHFIRLSI